MLDLITRENEKARRHLLQHGRSINPEAETQHLEFLDRHRAVLEQHRAYLAAVSFPQRIALKYVRSTKT